MTHSATWIIFDYGEVLSRRTTSIPAIARKFGVNEKIFQETYWRHRKTFDRGASPTEYWGLLADELGVSLTTEDIAEIDAIDIDGWLDPDPGSMALLRDLDEAGIPLALLSNAPYTFANRLRSEPFMGAFRHTVFSGEVNAAKPDAAIWRLVVNRIGVDPAECLFFDDREENVTGALVAGLRAELWTNAESARAALPKHGITIPEKAVSAV